MIDFTSLEKYDICDCHHHIYNPKEFPYPDTNTTQPASTAEDYMKIKKDLHIKRSVIVQPSCYGTDNSCSLDALEKLDSSVTRAIVVIDDDITMDELKRMDSLGVKGVRFNIAPGTENHVNSIKIQAGKIADLDWSMHFWMSADYTYEIRNVLQELPCQLVFDHRGHLPAHSDIISSQSTTNLSPAGINHPAFDFICEMMAKEKAWVKISGLYLDSICDDYKDTLKIGKEYVKINSDRVLWGTDWPHPVLHINNQPMPDELDLLKMIDQEISAKDDLQKILVENPAKLFHF
ncbi:MAG: amidohydrolase family protein [Lachnospiraceae bacterium]|nr:amidohydrolase family protein [Lachnospiraceae bacterium]